MSGSTQSEGGERFFRRVLWTLSAVAALCVAAQVAIAVWATHELTQAESLIAVHSKMLVDGRGLYYEFGNYPFAVNCYGPISYLLSAGFIFMGMPNWIGARLVSSLAMLGTVYFAGRSTLAMTSSRYAAWTAALLTAATANLLSWGTTGQVDVLGLCASIGAFCYYLEFENSKDTSKLWRAAALVALSIFVKQSFVAAGGAIALLLIVRHRRIGVWFTGLLAAAGAIVALAINWVTAGGYLDHGIFGNINPFSWLKVEQQAVYFANVAAALLALAVAAPIAKRRLAPIHLYVGTALLVLVGTAAKVGSDLNYQLELFVVLAVAAAWSLDQLGFFEKMFRGDTSWVTLLQIPLFLYCVLNFALTGRSLLERTIREQMQRVQADAVAPYFASERGEILSVHFDPLVQADRHMEVQPLIYTSLVTVGMINAEPLLADLAEPRFETVVLYENLFEPAPAHKNAEMPSLPETHLAAIRENYRLVDHLPGPYLNGLYIYEPRRAN